jgi:glutamate N-acetyltransferase / amino-acid N-acetyltransferase
MSPNGRSPIDHRISSHGDATASSRTIAKRRTCLGAVAALVTGDRYNAPASRSDFANERSFDSVRTMPVNLAAPDPARIKPVAGVDLGFAEAGIKKAGRRDLMLMRLAPGSRVAGVFTQNSFAAAPVQVCRQHLDAAEEIRALVINAGNANCGTGNDGIAAALRSCETVAQLVGCSISQVLPFSTGVILEPLPIKKIEAALPDAFASLHGDRWAEAAAAIMTTDTVAKAASRTVDIDGLPITVTGIAKGVGMIQPNMATMLAYVATDACISQLSLQRLVREVADLSFNRVTVDGDTSTNDSFVLIATGQAANAEILEAEPERFGTLRSAVVEVAQELAQAIARDGEGATKFITIAVDGALDEAEALRVARSIGNSPLVKTALFASDPNLGRLLMAIGNAGIKSLDTTLVDLWLCAEGDEVQVIEAGRRAPSYLEEDGARVMKPAEIEIRVALGRGDGKTVVWTCDFSYDYVKINAEYRT